MSGFAAGTSSETIGIGFYIGTDARFAISSFVIFVFTSASPSSTFSSLSTRSINTLDSSSTFFLSKLTMQEEQPLYHRFQERVFLYETIRELAKHYRRDALLKLRKHANGSIALKHWSQTSPVQGKNFSAMEATALSRWSISVNSSRYLFATMRSLIRPTPNSSASFTKGYIVSTGSTEKMTFGENG